MNAPRRELTPAAWFADSHYPGGGANDGWPHVRDEVLDTATDAQLARWLNLLGWPVAPGAAELGPGPAGHIGRDA